MMPPASRGAVSPAFDVERVRADFPILRRQVHGKPLVYLDNAATTQKPQVVLDSLTRYYTTSNANVHRGVHLLSQLATDEYEGAREKVRAYFNAGKRPGNRLHAQLDRGHQSRGARVRRRAGSRRDEVLISAMEHHSNIVPWQMLCERSGARLRVAPIDDRGELLLDEFEALGAAHPIGRGSAQSNALGTINPVATSFASPTPKGRRFCSMDRRPRITHAGDVRALDCDFYVATGHSCMVRPGWRCSTARHHSSKSCRRSWAAGT